MDIKKQEITHVQDTFRIKEGAERFPLMVVIGLSYVCNSKCPECPYTNSDIRNLYADVPFMPENIFKVIADQVGEHQAYLRISGGGEPFLHPSIIELVRYAKEKGCKVGIITNGSLVTEKRARALLECGVDAVEFSVDASDAITYARVRPGLDFDRLVRNVKRIVRLRNDLEAPTRILASGVNQLGVDLAKVEAFWTELVDVFQKRKFLTWAINEDHSADPTPYLPPEKNIPCPFLFERLNIDSRGNIQVCGFDIRATTNLGNILSKSISEIWLGPEFQYFRAKHLARKGTDISLCAQCPDWRFRSWQYNYWKLLRDAELQRNPQTT
jgi:radical SAM protein with 4Fe4S-binding SPASM domain